MANTPQNIRNLPRLLTLTGRSLFLPALLALSFLAVGAYAPQDSNTPLDLLAPQDAAACGFTGAGSNFDAVIEDGTAATGSAPSPARPYANSAVRVFVTIAVAGTNYDGVAAQWCDLYKYAAFGEVETSVLWDYMGFDTAHAAGQCDFTPNSRSSYRGYFFHAVGGNCATSTAVRTMLPPTYGQGYNQGWIKVLSCSVYAAEYAGYVNSDSPYGSSCSGTIGTSTGFNPFGTNPVFYDSVVPSGPTWSTPAETATFRSGNTLFFSPIANSFNITLTHTELATTTASGGASFTWGNLSAATGWTYTGGDVAALSPATSTKTLTTSTAAVSATLAVDSNDRAGNDGGNTTITFTRDATAPAIDFTVADEGTKANTTSTTPPFNWTESDAGSGIASQSGALQRASITAPNVCGTSWSTISTVTNPTTAYAPGAQTAGFCYRLNMTTTDNVGNVATNTSGSYLIDTTAPTCSISIANGATYTSSATVTVQMNGADTHSGLATMSVNGGSFVTAASTANVTLSGGDGTKTVTAQFRDNVGLTSSTCSDTIVMDTANPLTTTLTSTGTVGNVYGGTQWYRSSINVKLTASDATSGVNHIDYRKNGISQTPISGSTGNFTLSGNGTYAITNYLATDNAGNQEAGPATPVSLSIDTSSPDFTLAPIEEGCTGITGSAQYQLLGLTDNGGSSTDGSRSSFFRSEWWDGGSGAPAAPGVNAAYALPAGTDADAIASLLPSPGSGTRVMHVRIFDAAGNAAGDETMTVIVDGDAPDGTFSIVPTGVEGTLDGYTNTPNVTLDLSEIVDVGCSDLSQIRVSYDGGSTWQPTVVVDGASADIVLPYALDGSTDGPITVTLVAIDTLGNASAVGAIPDQTIFLDTLQPVGEQELNYGDEYAAGSHIIISPAASDPGEPTTGSGAYQVQFSNDGETWGIEVDDEFVPDEWADFSAGDTLPWTLLATEVAPGEEEPMTVYVRYRDRAGNISGVDDGTINLAGAVQPEFAVGARIYAGCDGSNETVNQTGNITWTSSQRLCLMPTVILVSEGREYVTADGQPCPPSTAAGSACRQIRGYIDTDSITINGEEVQVATPESITVTVASNPNQAEMSCEGIYSWDHVGSGGGFDWREFCFSQATSASGDQLFAAIPFTVEGTVHWEFTNPQPGDPVIAQNDIPFTLVENLTVDVRNLGQSN